MSCCPQVYLLLSVSPLIFVLSLDPKICSHYVCLMLNKAQLWIECGSNGAGGGRENNRNSENIPGTYQA